MGLCNVVIMDFIGLFHQPLSFHFVFSRIFCLWTIEIVFKPSKYPFEHLRLSLNHRKCLSTLKTVLKHRKIQFEFRPKQFIIIIKLELVFQQACACLKFNMT